MSITRHEVADFIDINDFGTPLLSVTLKLLQAGGFTIYIKRERKDQKNADASGIEKMAPVSEHDQG